MTNSSTLMGKKRLSTISKYKYLQASQVFHWAKNEHYITWFGKENGRHRRTESMLPRLVRKGKLVARSYGKRLIYTCPRRKGDKNIEHGLACTESLVRFYRSDPKGEIIAEHHFRGCGSIPEWGIRYPNGMMLLYEFCTADNYARSGIVAGKITRYINNLSKIERKYDAQAIVLFVIDATRRKVDRYVQKIIPAGEQFYFTDYKTFLYEPIGEQLSAPIYIWGEDGWPYSLRSEND